MYDKNIQKKINFLQTAVNLLCVCDEIDARDFGTILAETIRNGSAFRIKSLDELACKTTADFRKQFVTDTVKSIIEALSGNGYGGE